jgi:GNAT superfamily N-acetyltransferase
MGESSQQVRVSAAKRSDIGSAARTLARAFHHDPVMTWMLPDAGARQKKLPRLFALLMRYHHLATGGSEVARTGSDGTGIGAAALWDPPGRWKHGRLESVLALPALVLTFGRRVSAGRDVEETMQRLHPDEPHWYLAVIGSDPTVRGEGLGRALMASRLDRCDAEHAPAYLESSNPDNVPYYMRFGFEVTGEIVLPGGGPTMWPMWRPER